MPKPEILLEWGRWSLKSTISAKKGVELEETEINYEAPRCVYVISFKPPYAVEYLKGKSPVCYIGSGRAWRILAHKDGWLCKLPLILGQFAGYRIDGCEPRQRGRGHQIAYKRVESDLISYFVDRLGERPLFNRRLGNTDYFYSYPEKGVRKIQNIFAKNPGVAFSKSMKSINLQVGTLGHG
jgi:hypothetical protein